MKIALIVFVLLISIGVAEAALREISYVPLVTGGVAIQICLNTPGVLNNFAISMVRLSTGQAYTGSGSTGTLDMRIKSGGNANEKVCWLLGAGTGPGKYRISTTIASSCGDGCCNNPSAGSWPNALGSSTCRTATYTPPVETGYPVEGNAYPGKEIQGTTPGIYACPQDCACPEGQVYAYASTLYKHQCMPKCAELRWDSITKTIIPGGDSLQYQGCFDLNKPTGSVLNTAEGCQIDESQPPGGAGLKQCYQCPGGSGLYMDPATGDCDKPVIGDNICRDDFGEPIWMDPPTNSIPNSDCINPNGRCKSPESRSTLPSDCVCSLTGTTLDYWNGGPAGECRIGEGEICKYGETRRCTGEPLVEEVSTGNLNGCWDVVVSDPGTCVDY